MGEAMKKVDHLVARAFKGAMAFVLAVGLCPVAPAMAQEGATANEEGGAAAAAADGADASTNGAVAGAAGGVAGSEADGVQPGGVSGDGDAAADGAGVGAPAQDAVENDGTDSGVSVDAAEAAAVADGEADESNDAAAQTDGWQAWGGCEWMVDSEGCLTIRPKDGAEVGQLPTSKYWTEVPWCASDYRQSIQTVRVAAGVKISGYTLGLFGGLSSVTFMDLSGLDTSLATDVSYMFSGCSSLRGVSLGEATRVDLPTPSGDGLTGRWVSSADGVAYRPSDIPLGVASTYAAQRSDSVTGVANSAGSCMWKIDDNGVLLVAPLPGNESGELDCQRNSHEWAGETLWTSFASEINSVRIEPGVAVKGSVSGLFAGLSVAESMDLSGLDTSGVTNMSSMFSGCTLLRAVDLSSFDTSSVTSMNSMFDGCESLGALDLSSFDTSKVENMSQMFQGCSSLASLNLSSFDTSSVAGSDGAYYYDGMSGMFQDCSSLTSLDLSSFNTSRVRSMRSMFWNCKRLKSVNLSSFDTKNVACFDSMFWCCSALESLDLSNFNTSRAVGAAMIGMFYGCASLKSLDVSSFDTSRITDFSNIFGSCYSLESLDLSSFDTSRATKMDLIFGYVSALSRVTLGEKFSFSKNGERLGSLPSNGGDAGWYDESAGKAYSVDEIPDNVATTYIKQKRLEWNQFTVDESLSAYTGAPIKKPIKSDLVEGVDYVVSYENNIGPGSASIYIRGINRWCGELSYYFYIDGSAQRGQWMHDSNGWWYVDASGSYPSNEWRVIDGSYYYFNGSGYMCTNWLNYGGAWYWLGGSGAMATGWQSIGGSWYFFDDSGAMATGWSVIDGSYYYFNGSGSMQTGWLNRGGAWYYLSGSGVMATGWQTIGGTWYWFDASGAMATGWKLISGTYYFFDSSGAMQSDKWVGDYYLLPSGEMATNQWVGGYYVGADGRWVRGA